MFGTMLGTPARNAECLSKSAAFICRESPSLMPVRDDKMARRGSCWNLMTTTVRGVRCFNDAFKFRAAHHCWSGSIVTRPIRFGGRRRVAKYICRLHGGDWYPRGSFFAALLHVETGVDKKLPTPESHRAVARLRLIC